MAVLDGVLLLGNGPNRVVSDDFSWSTVLSKLADLAGSKVSVEGKPLPLVFEELVLGRAIGDATVFGAKHQSSVEADLRTYMARLIQKMRPNGIHAMALTAGFRHILTTNYDYCIEHAHRTIVSEPEASAFLPAHLVQEKKRSLFRRNVVATRRGDVFVWHVHGEALAPRSLVLGYNQYVRHVSNVASYLTSSRDPRRATGDAIHSPLLSGDATFDSSGRPYSWLDLFLRNDVYILGLALDYSEIALWWLLSFKARLMLAGGRRARKMPIGRTVFYSPVGGDAGDVERAKLELLEAMGVEVVRFDAERGFQRAYHSALKDIKARVRR